MLQFDIVAAVAKVFIPLVAAVTGVAHLFSATFGLFHRQIAPKVPTAVPLKALRTPNMLDGLSDLQIDRIRTRLLNEDAIREDNASALEAIDKRFGIERSAKTEYQNFKAVRPR
ncbi:MAG: hypothetical protein V7774_08125 [Pseudorhizobium pelagicum]|uniref:hypothetical protein n=1 Tax=Pseudorhizobium pelagicum TaxID=1509405 RepID=UPI00345FD961